VPDFPDFFRARDFYNSVLILYVFEALMNDENPKLFIHLGAHHYTKPGYIHLLASFQDYEKLQIFFSKHFDTLSYTHDEIGFPVSLYECPKDSMFLRDEKGELLQEKMEKAKGKIT
jgi:hypothetical protein